MHINGDGPSVVTLHPVGSPARSVGVHEVPAFVRDMLANVDGLERDTLRWKVSVGRMLLDLKAQLRPVQYAQVRALIPGHRARLASFRRVAEVFSRPNGDLDVERIREYLPQEDPECVSFRTLLTLSRAAVSRIPHDHRSRGVVSKSIISPASGGDVEYDFEDGDDEDDIDLGVDAPHPEEHREGEPRDEESGDLLLDDDGNLAASGPLRTECHDAQGGRLPNDAPPEEIFGVTIAGEVPASTAAALRSANAAILTRMDIVTLSRRETQLTMDHVYQAADGARRIAVMLESNLTSDAKRSALASRVRDLMAEFGITAAAG